MGQAPASEVAELSCGRNGGMIKAVRFASWGTPFGSCGSFGADDNCAVPAERLVERLCLGRSNCTLDSGLIYIYIYILGGVLVRRCARVLRRCMFFGLPPNP